MKKYKLLFSTLFLALALAFVNIQPVKVYADDSDGPQDTGQKKTTPAPTIPPEVITVILAVLRLL